MNKYLISLVILFLIVACNKNNTDKTSDTQFNISVSDSAMQQTQQDTFLINKPPRVVFFMPSQKEQQKIINMYASTEQYEFIQLFNDFYSFYSKASSALKSYNIPSELTRKKILKINLADQTQIITLKKEHQIMGFVLYDSTKYKVNYGIYNNKDFIKEIRKFYGIKFHF